MEKYDYYKNVSEDIKNNLEEWFDNNDIKVYSDLDELVNDIRDDFFDNDSVTGNASGSYTFSTWDAEENICHNFDLLEEACDEVGETIGSVIESGAETCDVYIRIYILSQIIYDIVKDYVEEHFPHFDLES